MKHVDSTVRFRLRPEHLDLVSASLARPTDAVTAYRSWHARVDLADADAGSYRLIPLLHRNLEGTGALSDTDSAHYGRMARFTWVKSQLILSRAEEAIGALRDAGIPALSIKGLAVLRHSGLGADLRPMDDADVAVPTDRALDALVALHGAGFHSDEVRLGERDQIVGLVAGHHGLNLRDASGVQVDLHWHVIPQSLHPTADRAMWERALDDVPSREDAFVHVLAHATRWSWSPSVQWIADAALLARDGLDWDVVVGEVTRHRIGVPCADAVAVLAMTGLADVPERIVPHLRRAPIAERIGGRVRRDQEGRWQPATSVERAAEAFGDHVRRVVAPGDRAGFGAAKTFLRERWALSEADALLRHAVFVGAGRPWGAPSTVRRALAAAPSRPTRSSRRTIGLGVGGALSFSLGGNGLELLDGGWSFAEDHGTWSIGSEAAVTVPLDEDVAAWPVVLRVRIVPLLTERVRTRRVDVVVDGVRAARWDFAGDGWCEEVREVTIPQASRSGRDRQLRFIVHRPVSPQALDHDVGTRQLGLSLQSITIKEAGAGSNADPAR